MTALVDRRSVVAAIGLMLGGCAAPRGVPSAAGFYPFAAPEFASAYGPVFDQGHAIPALDLTRIDPALLRQHTRFAGPYRPGTTVVNVGERRLYLVQPGGVAIRYAVGVGREEALDFHGSAVIGRKAEWPRWSPTADMIRRMPIYAHYTSGLPGGINNPLGARALYLYRGNQDTYFRLHGTNEPETIGTKVSSGCIRLFNHDIIATAFRSARRWSSCKKRPSWRCAPTPRSTVSSIHSPRDGQGHSFRRLGHTNDHGRPRRRAPPSWRPSPFCRP
jgi:lipoprotein-anchoring transpeptidase ErfK/SrfK